MSGDIQRGKFIAFEGGDANGKQTQSRLLAEKLDAKLFSFPRYETEIGKLIRANLFGQWWAALHPANTVNQAINPIVRQALFTFDRYDAAPDISDALVCRRNVVADRYWASGLIYGTSDLVNKSMLERVHECLPQPDVWILLDVPVEESFRRRPLRQDAYENDRKKLEDVRRRYLELFKEEQYDVEVSKNMARHLSSCNGCDLDRMIKQRMKQKWVVIDGVGPISEVHNRIMGVI